MAPVSRSSDVLAATLPAAAERHPDSYQLTRQWGVLKLLSEAGRAFSVKELAEQFMTSKSTIERDLATLETTFALVEEADGKQKKRYRIAERVRALEGMTFTLMELLALHAAHGALHFAAGAPFYEDLQSIIHKARGVLGPRHNGGLDAMARVFMPHARRYVDYSQFADTIDTLADTIARRLVCKLSYRAWNAEPKQHHARPLKLLFYDGALYLFAQLGDRKEVSVMAVHRILAAEATKRAFPVPRVDLDAVARKAFGIFIGEVEEEVEVIFEAKIARVAEERIFHPDERKQLLPDGRLRFQLKTAARLEVISWVLHYGDGAELKKPAAWRADVAAAARALVARHGG